jgi:hypothetical protein
VWVVLRVVVPLALVIAVDCWAVIAVVLREREAPVMRDGCSRTDRPVVAPS